MSTRRTPFSREIWELICAHCNSPTLTTLARLNRYLSEIALGWLWSEVQGLEELLPIAPPDSWTYETDNTLRHDVVVSA